MAKVKELKNGETTQHHKAANNRGNAIQSVTGLFVLSSELAKNKINGTDPKPMINKVQGHVVFRYSDESLFDIKKLAA